MVTVTLKKNVSAKVKFDSKSQGGTGRTFGKENIYFLVKIEMMLNLHFT